MYGSKDITADKPYMVTKSERCHWCLEQCIQDIPVTGLTVDNGWV